VIWNTLGSILIGFLVQKALKLKKSEMNAFLNSFTIKVQDKGLIAVYSILER